MRSEKDEGINQGDVRAKDEGGMWVLRYSVVRCKLTGLINTPLVRRAFPRLFRGIDIIVFLTLLLLHLLLGLRFRRRRDQHIPAVELRSGGRGGGTGGIDISGIGGGGAGFNPSLTRLNPRRCCRRGYH